ncbi:MAG: NAD(P)H-dependent oxidoreductase [Clostridiales bacterium]|nr:NAD(P)H-dependent oxidoreductase [Clostridiales bacterium]
MSLMVFNGSPRGVNSNSDVIASWFLKGFEESKTVYLNKVKQHETYINESIEFEKLLFVFPLYVDGMPGQVKYFFEQMNKQKKVFKNKEVTFIIHSGFSEAIHSKNLEKYLYRFADLMSMKNYGVVIIPGSEGFRLMPPKMTAKKAEKVAEIGDMFRLNKPFPSAVKESLEGPLVQSKLQRLLFKILSLVGLSNVYWNSQLKKNNAFKNRFDAPYEK